MEVKPNRIYVRTLSYDLIKSLTVIRKALLQVRWDPRESKCEECMKNYRDDIEREKKYWGASATLVMEL